MSHMTPEEKKAHLELQQANCEHGWIRDIGALNKVGPEICAHCGVPKLEWEKRQQSNSFWPIP